jgi:N-acyl-D-aspartate/D-glutamate deacylase
MTNTRNSQQPAAILLREQELAARWQTSRRSLQRWRGDGSGPPFLRIGNAIRYRLTDILAFEMGALIGSTAAQGMNKE